MALGNIMETIWFQIKMFGHDFTEAAFLDECSE
jgi:hypothetical protein